MCIFDFLNWNMLHLSVKGLWQICPANRLLAETFLLGEREGQAWLHNSLPEELLSDFNICFFIVVVRYLEWFFFWVLNVVPAFHRLVALSDYDSCHLPHSFPNEGLKVREYSINVAPLFLCSVKDPDCINLLSGRL